MSYFLRVTPRYEKLFGIIVKGVISLVSFSSCLSFESREVTDLLELTISSLFAEVVSQL